MNIKRKIYLLAMSAVILAISGFQSSFAQPGGSSATSIQSDTTRSLSPYFIPATRKKKTPDPDGFIQRWLLLEPINKPNRRNNVLSDSYIRTALTTEYFSNQFTILPKDGEKVKAGDQELTWHAVESTNFNVKLFRFAYGLNKQIYGVIFWAVTVVNCPEEMKNVRMSVGSNASSMWWLNGKEVAVLTGDIHMVVDDYVTARLTLNKGKNIIRGGVINGPGMSDFCLRFLDEKGEPIRNITITCE
jgi:hypothetical protein